MDIKEVTSKGLKGCGCLSIGMFLMKDSVVVNDVLEGDPYKELDDLKGGFASRANI